jgi:hypothetical protein
VPVIGPDDFPPNPVPGAVCAWTIDTSCCAGWDAFDPALQETATAWATEILDALTGHQFAQCPVKLRPCGERQGCFFGGYLAWPVNAPTSVGAGFPWMIPFVGAGGVWRNCTCAGLCRCRATCEAKMPYPIAEVLEVISDGVVLDPSAYRVDDGNILVRTDGVCFPRCQDLDLPDTEENTWSVTLRPGSPLPRSGAIAAGRLACEFAKLCAGDSSCALPEQLISLSRNGVEVQVADPQQLLDAGLTDIAEVNLFIKAVNPQGLRQRPRVFSPDIRQPRQVRL